MTGKPTAVELAHIAASLASARPDSAPEELVAEAARILEAAAQHVEASDPLRPAREIREAARRFALQSGADAAADSPELRVSWKDLSKRIPRSRPEYREAMLRRFLTERGNFGPVEVPGEPGVEIGVQTGPKAVRTLLREILETGMDRQEAERFLAWVADHPPRSAPPRKKRRRPAKS